MGRKAGEPATAKQRAAGVANLAKGRQAREEHRAANADHPTAKERWAMLLSGVITVADLDDAEITKRRVRGKGGEFNGRAPAVPSHLIKAFEQEEQKRWKRDLLNAVPDAIQALTEILADDENPQRANMVKWTLERAMGKTPDVVRIEDANTFERLSEEVVVDRGLADEAEAYLARGGAGPLDEA